ncbi:oligopeptide ABC transporter ATP-binding protein, partial [Candidatus Atribacteria bacterium 1244-E10-H5-B2]
TKKIILKGEIPSPINPPLGCRFHTRCSEKIGEICEKVSPLLKEIKDKHFVACHLYD